MPRKEGSIKITVEQMADMKQYINKRYSKDDIAKLVHVSERTVGFAKKLLKDNGDITVELWAKARADENRKRGRRNETPQVEEKTLFSNEYDEVTQLEKELARLIVRLVHMQNEEEDVTKQAQDIVSKLLEMEKCR